MAGAKAGAGGEVEGGFVKFPRTPHLVWLGDSSPRGERMQAAEAAQWLRRPMSVEEKVDGANLGLSLGAAFDEWAAGARLATRVSASRTCLVSTRGPILENGPAQATGRDRIGVSWPRQR